MTRIQPSHPGESILLDCIEPLGLTIAEAATHIQVSEAALRAICECRSPVTADMAVRIDLAFGGGAETWLALQTAHDLAKARRNVDGLLISRFAAA